MTMNARSQRQIAEQIDRIARRIGPPLSEKPKRTHFPHYALLTSYEASVLREEARIKNKLLTVTIAYCLTDAMSSALSSLVFESASAVTAPLADVVSGYVQIAMMYGLPRAVAWLHYPIKQRCDAMKDERLLVREAVNAMCAAVGLNPHDDRDVPYARREAIVTMLCELRLRRRAR